MTLKAKDSKAVEADKAAAETTEAPAKKPLATPTIIKGTSKIKRIDN
jgi:hypothetical protein